MTLYDFISLSEPCQAKTVWQGEFMTFLEENEASVMLYRVHGFYVESFYQHETNKITRFNPFRSKARLGLYFTASLN